MRTGQRMGTFKGRQKGVSGREICPVAQALAACGGRLGGKMEIRTGRILLAASCPPPVGPGRITVEVSQKLSGDGKLKEADLQGEKYVFRCEAQGLSLEEGEIYSVYPPADAFGLFETVLPHMVLRRRTLPWARSLQIRHARPEEGGAGVGGHVLPEGGMEGKEEGEGSPWMALLLFSEEEDAKAAGMKAGEAFRVQEDVYCPVTWKEGYDKEKSCTVLDVEAGLFCAVCPEASDLPFLAHARCVNRDDKAAGSVFQGEWLSVLTCSRLPRSGSGEKGLRNTLYLVSLEDFGTFLADRDLRDRVASGKTWKKVRIPVLASRSFYSKKEEYGFAECFHALTAGSLRVESDRAVQALPLLQRGFTAHGHLLRDGGRTVSLYHGPFLPWDAPVRDRTCAVFPDARLIYQPELGMFDVSMSAAANLGRMLGLQDRAFSKALLRFRKGNRLEAQERYYRETFLQKACGMRLDGGIGGGEDLNTLLDGEMERLLRDAFEGQRDLLMGREREARTEKKGKEEDVTAWRDPYGNCQRKRRLLQEGTYYGFLEDAQIPAEITDFLAGLSLLYQVPFSYLVPEEQMLPECAIRFFRLDEDWLYGLLDGAMSLGRNFEEDYAQDKVLIEKILSLVYEGRCRIRPTFLRKSEEEKEAHVRKCLLGAGGGTEDGRREGNHGGRAAGVNTGFLLRSELVRGFEGIEFAAYGKAGDGMPLPCLRLEVIGKDILLGIYAGECDRLEIRQPPEGMHFGMEKSEGGFFKRLRRMDTGEPFPEEEGKQVRVVFRDEETGVADLAGTAAGIGKLLGIEKMDSARMALEMIQNPFTGVVEREEDG